MGTTTPPTDEPFDYERAREEWDKEARKLGRFNLAVFGKTGVGKSTLVNAIFGDEVARTGIGKPVTEGSHLYVTTDGTLGLYDTQGLEIGVSAGQMLKEIRSFVESKRTADASHHIHAAYYCIRAGDLRIEPAERDFISGLHELGLPVFLVMTQVHRKGEVFRQEHLQFAEKLRALGLPIHSSRPYLTAALPDTELGYESFGLPPLLRATYEKAPEAARAALAAAQKIDRSLKHEETTKRIAAAATLAAGVGASPIPFSDAALLIPIQVGMMLSIAQVYRVPMDAALVSSLAAANLAANAGKAVVANALKLLPGVNLAVYGVSAAVAAASTSAMGAAWRIVCEMIIDGKFGPVDEMDYGQIRSVFMQEFQSAFTKAVDSVVRMAQKDG